ncbi:DUF3034 family protein [Candidatus Parabeggiatoa sp. HSG14]|uniref:DUF3034 family protein n=1 Tax=Candidatus Parabeggiatoa sp. HSG14 TaxID=3055593 RepID=UPI0025A8C557|nr:DUF3034 family protein [Thiotrichales bacterium HSG14]
MKLLKTAALTLAMGSFCIGTEAAVTQVEGQAGGGIVPWGLLSGGKPTVSATWVDTGDYTLSSVALQGSIAKWVELSYAKITFDTGRHPKHDGLGTGPSLDQHKDWLIGKIDLDVLGVKVKVLDMNETMPAVAVGLQFKKTNVSDMFLNPRGADDTGVDFYVAATKVMPIGKRKLLLNGTLRATKANQIGILGFGSKWEDSYSAMFEGSAGIFLNDKTVVGVEYRMKPDNIEVNREDDWGDLFFAYFPTPNMAIVAAAAVFGDIAGAEHMNVGGNNFGLDQRGLYLQVQANF